MSSRRVSGIAVTFAALLGALPGLGQTAEAQVTAAEAACRATIAKSMGKYVKTLSKAILDCHKRRDRGDLGVATDCNDPLVADSTGLVTGTYLATYPAISQACESAPSVLGEFTRCPVPHQAIDDGDATDGIDDFFELTLCLLSHATGAGEDTARAILGLPLTPLDEGMAKCHAALGKAYVKTVNATIKRRSKCQGKRDKAGGQLAFACATEDRGSKLQVVREKAAQSIIDACASLDTQLQLRARGAAPPGGLAALDSCSKQIGDLVGCVLDDESETAADGMASAFWELPGICPSAGSYTIAPVVTNAEYDVGFGGLGSEIHDRDPALGYSGVVVTVSCDADCANCATTAISSAPDACRCRNDTSWRCTNDEQCFGSECDCYYAPPTPVTAGVFSACLLGRVDGAMTGGVDPLTGDTSVTLPLDVGIFLGTDIGEPCPLCTLGECSAGVRAGQFCQVDGSDATFGDVSYDCMPNGFGTTTDHFLIQTSVTLTTGAVSLPFAVPCDPPFENQICACGICSGNLDVACNSDAECAAAGAGTCTADSGRGRVPNRCDDSICTQDPAGPPGEGKCLAGPTYSWCDGFVSSSGGGVIPCSDDLDCGTHADDCPGSNCGQCTLQQQAECFLDPIEAQGVPGKSLVGIGCLGRTIWHGFDQAVGIPGAYRVRTSMRSEVYCSNGVTPYVPPGGSNCSSLPGCLEAVVLCGPIEHHEFAGAMLWSVARDGTLTGSASVCQDFGCAGDVSGRIDAAGHVEATLTFEDGRQFAFGGTVGCNGLGSGTWKPGVGTWSIVPCG